MKTWSVTFHSWYYNKSKIMKDTALFAKLLELTPPWTVTSLEPDLGEKTNTIKIEWPNGKKAPCPECESPCSIYDHREERVWRHLDTSPLLKPTPIISTSCIANVIFPSYGHSIKRLRKRFEWLCFKTTL